MNSWQKGITFISAALCILALVALSLLASKTTAVAKKDAQAVGAWPQPQSAMATEGAGLQLLIDLLPLLAEEANKIAEALAKLNASPSVVPNELLLTFKSPEALQDFLGRAGAAGINVINSDPRLLSARVGYSDPMAMARELSANAGGYENVAPNYLAWIPGLPSDSELDPNNAGGREPYGNSGMAAIGATSDRATWGKGVVLAILDTGVMDHPDLKNAQIWHYDLVNDGQTPNGHGTAMASLAVGSGEENGGAAQAARVLDIRVADVEGESNTALVAQAIMQAVDQGASVINISLGTNGDSLMLQRAVAYALKQGVVVVAAAGNEQQTTLAYPANYAGVISVGAVDATGKQAYFSNSGYNLTVAAPGVGIVSAYGADSTVIGSGTSQSAAITSGTIAAMIGFGYSPADMLQSIVNSARPTGAPKAQVGAGIVQVKQK